MPSRRVCEFGHAPQSRRSRGAAPAVSRGGPCLQAIRSRSAQRSLGPTELGKAAYRLQRSLRAARRLRPANHRWSTRLAAPSRIQLAGKSVPNGRLATDCIATACFGNWISGLGRQHSEVNAAGFPRSCRRSRRSITSRPVEVTSPGSRPTWLQPHPSTRPAFVARSPARTSARQSRSRCASRR
jgi:hypothetical protein